EPGRPAPPAAHRQPLPAGRRRPLPQRARRHRHRHHRTATSVRGDHPLAPPQNKSGSLSLDYTDHDLAGGQLQAQLFWTRFDARYGSFRYVDFFNTGSTDTWDDQTVIDAEKLGGK